MKTDNSELTVLVTGGSGYLASWIIKYLLDDGHTVNTTIRNPADKKKYDHLSRLAVPNHGKLRLYESDLISEGSFDEAARNCRVVIHTASPFKLTGIRDAESELVIPAVKGVQNVFSAAVKSRTVRRIVMTSSVAAIYGDAVDIKNTGSGIFNEDHWNHTSSLCHQPYSYSKTLAEKEAWKLAGKYPEIELSVINPGFILGPSLSPQNNDTSNALMKQLGSGTFRIGVPKGMHALVDARDVARAHILAAFSPVSGLRFIAAPHHSDFRELAQIIKSAYPHLPVPKNNLPTWLFLLAGPLLGYPGRLIRRNVGYPLRFDNSRIIRELGIRFRPLKDTLIDHFGQLIKDNLISNPPKTKYH